MSDLSTSGPDDAPAPGADHGPAESDVLRARVAELEARLATVERVAPATARDRSRWTPAVSAFLVVLACLLAPFTVVAVWAHTQVSDTERFVETVAPLAGDAGVQSAVSTRVTEAITESVGVESLANDVLAALSQREDLPPALAVALPGLAAPIADGIESFVRSQVERLVASTEFDATWARVSRSAHAQLVALLDGTPDGVLSAQGDTVTANLAPVIAQARGRLVANGFTAADRIPEIERSIVLVRSDALVSTQRAYRLLDGAALWLPWVALVAFVGGVLLARGRRETLVRGAVGLLVSMLVLGLALLVVRALYLRAIPPDGLPPDTAATVFDILVRSLRDGLRATAVLALVVAAVAFLAGPSRSAVRTRTLLRRVSRTVDTTRDAGRVGTWVGAHRRQLQVTTVTAAAAVLVLQTAPSAGGVVLVTVVCLVILGVIELLAVAPARSVVSPARGDPPGGT
ncbi:hypothetical protein [Sanguibacter sp. 25GB23B1]|uniref:hypothetical protein n=1 Tax=unclassified Sanguibacter TaxID=2645534 RepID=UPI0032AEA0A8